MRIRDYKKNKIRATIIIADLYYQHINRLVKDQLLR